MNTAQQPLTSEVSLARHIAYKLPAGSDERLLGSYQVAEGTLLATVAARLAADNNVPLSQK
jgi:hypothetical protein